MRRGRNRVGWRQLAAACIVLALGSTGCAKYEAGAEARVCAQLVRFHLGLHHPVEVLNAEETPGKPSVRIAYEGTRTESASIDGVALCRLTDQTGELQVHGALVNGTRVEPRGIRAFNKFAESRRRGGG